MKIIKFWFPLAIYSGIIFYISSIPNLKSTINGNNTDKIFHCIEYIPLGFLSYRAFFSIEKVMSKWSIFFLTIGFCLLYGISDEIHQFFVVGRDSDFYDVLADLIGALIGISAFCFYKFKFCNSKN